MRTTTNRRRSNDASRWLVVPALLLAAAGCEMQLPEEGQDGTRLIEAAEAAKKGFQDPGGGDWAEDPEGSKFTRSTGEGFEDPDGGEWTSPARAATDSDEVERRASERADQQAGADRDHKDRARDAVSACHAQYEPELVCQARPGACTFHARTDGATCRDYCGERGGKCLAADHDLGGVSCEVEGRSSCDQPAGDMLCTCSTAPPQGAIHVYEVRLLWGQRHLNPPHRGTWIAWDGSAELHDSERGTIERVQPIRFERHDEITEKDLLRVAWISRTNVHNDGLELRVRVHRDEGRARLVLRTEQIELDVPLSGLERYRADFIVNPLGDELSVRATRVATFDPEPQQPQCERAEKRLQVRAEIDGRSQLVVRDFLAYYHHDDHAAPGRLNYHGGSRNVDAAEKPRPTFINGAEWQPSWPEDGENRDCDCDSSVFASTDLLVPLADANVSLNIIEARHAVRIVEAPDAGNGYALVLEFDDNPPGGAAWYEVEVVFDYLQCDGEPEFWCDDPGVCETDCAYGLADRDCDSCQVADGGCVEGCPGTPDPDCR